jgi:hypothetical protein
LGLHLISDIGASTFDIATFVLNENRYGEDQYSLLATEVEPLRVLRLQEMRKTGQEAKFREICKSVISHVVWVTKKQRDPNSPAWEKGLPSFIYGGGALEELYGQLFIEVEDELSRQLSMKGFEVKTLPIPSDLSPSDLLNSSYSRLAVAYGLSFSYLDIGSIKPPRSIQDVGVSNISIDLSNRYVDKDMV